MSRVRVKICGVRSLAEARSAVELGADALGFNFWQHSARHIDLDHASAIIRELPPFIGCIGVFVNDTVERIRDVVKQCGLAGVQLHGDEPPAFCQALEGIRLIKAFRVDADFDPAVIKSYLVNAVLLDSKTANYGGSGRTFDWHQAVAAKAYAPVILAGGLNADNIGEAIASVTPMAVDVCSGVEAEPGRKDFVKMRAFMSAVSRANARIAVAQAELLAEQG
jgi:phosphoribosylanthranilate isomerase